MLLDVMHIVWDWNGTLFDDRDAILDATNEVFHTYGLPPMELDHYRSVYSRPIWASYERILGRALEDGEWERLDAAFHDTYHRLMERCGLAAGAQDAIDLLAGKGHTQSVLSMWRHDRLGVAVRELGIHLAFRRVDGLRPAEAGAEKAEFMVRHLAALGVGAADVVMVGDSADDATAARHVGARAVLYTGGLQTRADLERLGVPVVDHLSDVTAHI
jgi:phosphoglycolate phosphatase-like HAD superfamily hydrolase